MRNEFQSIENAHANILKEENCDFSHTDAIIHYVFISSGLFLCLLAIGGYILWKVTISCKNRKEFSL